MPRIAAIALAALLTACGNAGDALPSGAAAPAGEAEPPVVNFANFAEEIGPDTLAGFERETGIHVVYDVYDSNAALEAKLLAGHTGYDVVVPGNNFLEHQVRAGIYQPLQRAALPNWRHLDPQILHVVSRNDPDNRHGVPYVYGTHAFGYNVEQVRKALGHEPPDSWALLFEPDNARRLQSCGMSVPDSPWVMTSHALRYLGRDPNSESARDLADAMRVLNRIRPHLRDVSNSLEVSSLAEGTLCLAVAPSADIRLARDQADEAGTGVTLRYVVPQEGALLWFDMLAIPADAPHPGNAHKLLDYLMRPEVIAKVTSATYLANANKDADELVPAALRQDPLIYPDAAAMRRLQVNASLSAQYSRLQNREFTRFRNAQ